jgi:hypothetical protein
MSEQQQITADQYVTMAKIDSLAKQNASQAVRIADLEAQISLYQQQQQQSSEEEPVFEEVNEPDQVN